MDSVKAAAQRLPAFIWNHFTAFGISGDYGWLPHSKSMSAAVRQCLSELSIALTLARQFRRLRMFRIMDGLWINGGLRGFNRKMF